MELGTGNTTPDEPRPLTSANVKSRVHLHVDKGSPESSSLWDEDLCTLCTGTVGIWAKFGCL